MIMSMRKFTILLGTSLMCLSLSVAADNHMKKEGMMDKASTMAEEKMTEEEMMKKEAMDKEGMMEKDKMTEEEMMKKEAMDKKKY